MNVDDVYLKELYKDFHRKSKSIKVYLERLTLSNSSVIDKSVSLVSALQDKYKILTDFRQKKMKPNPATSFSLSDDFDRQALEAADDSISKVDQRIEQNKKSINYEFSKIKEELRALEALCNKYAEAVNEIYDTWEGIIETKE